VTDTTRELPLLMGGGHGEPERLLLIGVPDEHGRVQVRIWTSSDWSLPPRMRDETSGELLESIESMSRAGHSLNQSLTTVRQWLHGVGMAAR